MDKLLNVVPQEPSKEITNALLNDISHSSIPNIPNIETNKQFQLNSNYLNRQMSTKKSDDNVRSNNQKHLLMNQNAYNQINKINQQSINNNNNNNASPNNSNSASIKSTEIVQEQVDDSIKNNNNNMLFDNKGVLTNPSLNTNNGLLLHSNISSSPFHRDVLLKQSNNTNEFSMKDLLTTIDMLSFQQQHQQQNSSPFNRNLYSTLEINSPHSKTPSTTSGTTFSNLLYDIPQIPSSYRNNNQIGNDIIDNCISLCKEQSGCRLLQKKIDENPQIACDIIYPKIRDKIKELSNDQFGNYFVQKIIEYITPEQLEDLLKNKVATIFRELSLNQHGTRVIQKIFEKIINNESLLSFFILILIPNLMDFLIDANATHIIIKYVSLIQSPGNDFIIEFLAKNIIEIATQKHSCSTLQKCIEFANIKQKQYLLLTIANNSYNLFMDQYGNYVVQFVVSLCDYDINKVIVMNLLKDFQKFSSQKYSSNVIEKSLDCCNDETKQMIVEALCEPKLVSSLLFDMYGNYVLQKTMSISKEPYRTKFIQMVGPYLENLKMLTFGLKLYNKLLNTFPELYAYTKNDLFTGTNNVNNNNYKKRNKKQKQFQNIATPMQTNPSIGLQAMNPQMNMFMQQNPNMMNNHNTNMNNHYNNMYYQQQNQFYNNNAFPSNTFRNIQPQMNTHSNVYNIQPTYENNNNNFLQQNAFMSQNVMNPSSVYYNQSNKSTQGGNYIHNYYK